MSIISHRICDRCKNRIDVGEDYFDLKWLMARLSREPETRDLCGQCQVELENFMKNEPAHTV